MDETPKKKVRGNLTLIASIVEYDEKFCNFTLIFIEMMMMMI